MAEQTPEMQRLAERAWHLQAKVHLLRIEAERRVIGHGGKQGRNDFDVLAINILHSSTEYRLLTGLWDLYGLVIELAGGVTRAAQHDG